ncbi:MAG: ATP synthase F1 subunit gamma [Sarcina sp.]
MPAAGLLVIKQRIKSVKSTQKITKAMALVSTAKAKKAKKMLLDNDMYFEKLEMMRSDVFREMEDFKDSKFVQTNDSDKKLYVVFASNSGFCGGFNAGAISYLADKYPSKEEREKVKLFVIGSKALSYAKKYGFEVVGMNDTIKGDIDIKTSRNVVRQLMNKFYDGEFNGISFVYTKFKSSVVQELTEVPVLPITVEENSKTADENIDIFEIGENPEILVTSFVYRYMEGIFINTVYSAMSSEENARMQAMDGATKNANEIIDDLNTAYNRIRQAAITQEISEIVGGAEAQK